MPTVCAETLHAPKPQHLSSIGGSTTSTPTPIDSLTGIGTLRNLNDERDARVLSRMEYAGATVRAVQFGTYEADVPRTFDGAHLRAIYGHLFHDVYE